jgi:hypothetical protein
VDIIVSAEHAASIFRVGGEFGKNMVRLHRQVARCVLRSQTGGGKEGESSQNNINRRFGGGGLFPLPFLQI